MKTKFKTLKLNIIFILFILALLTSIFAYTQKGEFFNLENQSKIEKVLYNKKEDILYNEESNNLKKEFEVKEKSLSVLMVGDIMTDRYIRKQINREGNAENFVKNYLNNLPEVNKNYDYVVANLEGPITENKSKTLNADGTYGKDLLFTFPTSTTQILNLLNIKIVSLANNHTDNFYHTGYESTKKFLQESNIKYFGNPYNTSSKVNNIDAEKYDHKENNINSSENLSEIFCQKEICVAYIGYNQFTKNNNSELIIKEIERLKSGVDFIIIMPHWGEEYEKQANQNQEKLARAWIDAGADAVIGSHPHVIQNHEAYKDKHIFYSLGNYIFDQWFKPDVQNGLGVNIIFEKISIGKEDDTEYKVEKSMSIKEDNNKNIFIDRNGVRYK